MENTNAEPAGDDDNRSPYKLLLTCPSGLTPSQVSVVFDEAYGRIPHPEIDLENSISGIWDLRVQQNASLFNGKKFRYGGYALHSGTDSNWLHHVCLHLGLTDYRTFVGTNLNPMWERFLVPSEDDCRQCQHTSSPLGNGAVVETSDKKILVLQRSFNVGEFPGHYVFPGGHPEPEEVGIVSHQYGKDSNNAELMSSKLSQEMFDSIIREVVEEIGVPATTLYQDTHGYWHVMSEKRKRYVGRIFIVLDLPFGKRLKRKQPVELGLIASGISYELRAIDLRTPFKINGLQSKEIQQLYSSAQDGYESTQLYTVSMNDLEIMSPKMPGCHQGGFALYKLMVEEAKDA